MFVILGELVVLVAYYLWKGFQLAVLLYLFFRNSFLVGYQVGELEVIKGNYVSD